MKESALTPLPCIGKLPGSQSSRVRAFEDLADAL